MGWTSFRYDGRDPLKIIREEIREHHIPRMENVRRGKNKGEIYMAVDIGEPAGIIGVVVLWEVRRDGDFAYKIMCEDAGPCYHGASKTLLELLSPPPNEYARKWREQCCPGLRLSAPPQQLALAI